MAASKQFIPGLIVVGALLYAVMSPYSSAATLGLLGGVWTVLCALWGGVRWGLAGVFYASTVVVLRAIQGPTVPMDTVTSGICAYLVLGTGVGLAVDYTRRQRDLMRQTLKQLETTHQELLTSEEQLWKVLDSLMVGVVIVDQATCRILYANPMIARMVGTQPEEVVGQDCKKLMGVDKDGVSGVSKTDLSGSSQVSMRQVDGSVLPVLRSVVPITYHARASFLVSVVDLRDRLAMEEELRALSLQDALTGLHNRRGFQVLAEQQLLSLGRLGMCAHLLFIDLDGMKRVNDRDGHEAGDRMLRDAATILRGTFRASDVVARLGGDEFVVFALTTPEVDPHILMHRLQEGVARFNANQLRAPPVCMSVGLATAHPGEKISLDTLQRAADQAMYTEKQRRKSLAQQPRLPPQEGVC